MDNNFITSVLKLFAKYDAREDLLWFDHDGELGFAVICSDTFAWGCADCEEITPERLPILEQAFVDAVAASPVFGNIYAGVLYCARIRQTRPQSWIYNDDADLKPLWPLFDACGPKTEN